MQLLLLGGILILQSVYDLRKKQLPLWITLTGMGIGLLLWILEEKFDVTKFAGIIPGLLCLMFSKVSREAMGYGDGLLICMMGIYLGLTATVSVCMWAFVLAAVTALFLLIVKKKKGKQEMPFVPFLFLGFGLEVLLC